MKESNWILPRHTSDWEKIRDLLDLVPKFQPLDAENKKKMWKMLNENKLAAARNKKYKADSINHRFELLEFFMLGYFKTSSSYKIYLNSAIGKLFFDNKYSELEKSKILLAALWNVQLQHPFHINSTTNNEFELYPFRLLYKLMMESDLDYRLSLPEYVQIVSKIKKITETEYVALKKEILAFRKITNEEKFNQIKSREFEHIDALYTWGYYYKKILYDGGCLDVIQGNLIGKLSHPKRPTTKNKTYRKLSDEYYEIPKEIRAFCNILSESYPFYENITKLKDERKLSDDIKTEIYNFLPEELLSEIGIDNVQIKNLSQLSNLPTLLKKYSRNPDLENAIGWEEFEKKLTDAFNLFKNVRANWLGGAGNTDIECLFTDIPEKFAADAKATSSKLSTVNSKRLKTHRDKIKAKYTIIITPEYSPAVLNDIEGEPVTIFKISSFVEYLQNFIVDGNQFLEMDYAEIRDIVISSYGEDASNKLSKLTNNKFGYKVSI